jgi:endogenous inhibitor of DNA gyrase (YacG/DUF329 family)
MQCPICKKPVDDADLGKPGSFYPFCSDRCRLIDLGRWLSGKYAIPVRQREEENDERDSREPRDP